MQVIIVEDNMNKLYNILLNNEAFIEKMILENMEYKRYRKVFNLKNYVEELDIMTFTKILLKYIYYYTNKNDDLCKEIIDKSCVP